MAQQYAPLLAGFQLLQSKEKLDESLAKLIVDDTDLEFKAKESDESDENECLRHLLTKQIHINGGINTDTTIFEMAKNSLESLHQQKEWIDSLARHGIVIKDNAMVIANNHSAINSIFKGTKWVGFYQRSLLRIKGADNCGNKAQRIGGAVVKTVRIPLDVVGVTKL